MLGYGARAPKMVRFFHNVGRTILGIFGGFAEHREVLAGYRKSMPLYHHVKVIWGGYD